MLKASGPLLFAANHPNSFLDGVILTTLLENDLYSLARGDAFANKRFRRVLLWLRQLPVYRTSEGKENLHSNYDTFRACHEVFKKNGLVLIFSEGRCINEWHLRPLKKGTARLALSTWQQGIDLTIVPVGFNYNPFRNFGKNVFINFGEPIKKELVTSEPTEGRQLLAFNNALRQQLQTLVFEIDASDKEALRQQLSVRQPALKKVLLAPLAALGLVLHAPLYFPVKALAANFFDNDHFDSIMACLQMLIYPFYLGLLCVAAGVLFGWSWALVVFFIAPLSAWALVQVKNQV